MSTSRRAEYLEGRILKVGKELDYILENFHDMTKKSIRQKLKKLRRLVR